MSMGFGELGQHFDIEHVRMHPEDELGLNKDDQFEIVRLAIEYPERSASMVRLSNGHIKSGCTGYSTDPHISGVLKNVNTHELIDIDGFADLRIRSETKYQRHALISVDILVWDSVEKMRNWDDHREFSIDDEKDKLMTLIYYFGKSDNFDAGVYDIND